jgi:hypothetical protein
MAPFNWSMNWVDTMVMAVYLFGITTFGVWVGFRRHASSEQYFLANKSLRWFTVGAAVFTSNISTYHLVGLAAAGAKDGMAVGNFEWMACFTLILLALVFAPFYIRSKVSTLPEFMERRYCPHRMLVDLHCRKSSHSGHEGGDRKRALLGSPVRLHQRQADRRERSSRGRRLPGVDRPISVLVDALD